MYRGLAVICQSRSWLGSVAAVAVDDEVEMEVKTEHELIASVTVRQPQQPAAFGATSMKSHDEWMSRF